jgi:AbrB family looped-hinge helix DNA binding protein
MESKISSKGQIVIPKKLREKVGAKTGQRVQVEEVGGTFVIVPIPKNPVKAMRGLSKGIFVKSSTEIVRELRKAWK